MTAADSAHLEEGKYRVLLIGLEDDTEENRESFCKNISLRYNIADSHLRNIISRCPIILKKNLTYKKAETLAKTLRFFRAFVSVEERIDFPPTVLEFRELTPSQFALESFHLWRSQSGIWNGIGRVRNLSGQTLEDIWVLLQVFDDQGEVLTFEEVPLSINPLPAGEVSPFKALFDGHLPIKSASLALKNSTGKPLPGEDRRKKRGWREVLIDSSEEPPAASSLMGEEVPSSKSSSKGLPSLEKKALSSLEVEKEKVGRGEGLAPVDSFPADARQPPSEMEAEGTGGDKDTLPAGGEKSEEEPIELSEPVGEEEWESEIKTSFPELTPSQECREEALDQSSEAESQSFAERKESGYPLEDISDREPPPFLSWMDDFRKSVEIFYCERHDPFSAWFDTYRKEEGGEDKLHSILVLLVHARFAQPNHGNAALENTLKVSHLMTKSNISLDEVPSIEGTAFASPDQWRNSFYKAIPKLRQIAREILEKENWDASELERLIQVIPHVSARMSRMAVRWIHDLIPDGGLAIDFSKMPVLVSEGVYRVASRLGVVDPQFDYYRGTNSMGDLKIQSFAKAAFPQDPSKIEEPMMRSGIEEAEGGHCFSVHPQCGGCLFEVFCPRLHVSINPSERGMKAN